ncbi:MAG: hypothetical protein AAGC55_20625, partial [Myxococcota bacterium]
LYAEAVAETLHGAADKRGLALSLASADIVGLGALRPIASSETREGRARNRRVEVWLREL